MKQSLRNMVIFKKICFGTRSQEGSYSHSVLSSLLLAVERQGKHPLDFFETLFKSNTSDAYTPFTMIVLERFKSNRQQLLL